MKAGLAKQITPEMNRRGASKLKGASWPVSPESLRAEDDRKVQESYNEWLSVQWEEYSSRNTVADHAHREQAFWSGETVRKKAGQESLTLGFVTKDACPGVGDDIEHIPGMLLIKRKAKNA